MCLKFARGRVRRRRSTHHAPTTSAMIVATDCTVAVASFAYFNQPGESAIATLAAAHVGFTATKASLGERMS
ncbi:MAG TPA: hypothetical protein VNN08_21405 [Thermoanaerobaculia bacterium]|nr:hypothetical protein [Thermoanaerobaculia bacterium]